MPDQDYLRKLLNEVSEGKVTPKEAEKKMAGFFVLPVSDIANLDIGRSERCGVPEVVLAEGKQPKHLLEIAENFVEQTGRCIISRVDDSSYEMLMEFQKKKGLAVSWNKDAGMMVISSVPPEPVVGGVIGIITAGTSDIRVAEEAKVIAEQMGCRVKTAYDVGAAGIHRLFPALENMQDCAVFVVAAGREGTLPAVVAGLVDRPVIGVPVSTGYGYMGKGEAALASMLQSCAVIATVNIDAGFVAGAFAAQVALLVGEKHLKWQ